MAERTAAEMRTGAERVQRRRPPLPTKDGDGSTSDRWLDEWQEDRDASERLASDLLATLHDVERLEDVGRFATNLLIAHDRGRLAANESVWDDLRAAIQKWQPLGAYGIPDPSPYDALLARVLSAEQELAKLRDWPGPDEDDRPLPEDDAIRDAHPTRSERHEEYGEAMRLVGARRTKGGLVALVHWLLVGRADAEREVERLRRART